MFLGLLEKCQRRLGSTEIDRLVARRTKPCRGGRPGSKLGAGTQGESPAESELVGMQPERHQQCPYGRIRPAGLAPQADAPELGEGHRGTLRHAREGDCRRPGVGSRDGDLSVTDLGEPLALRARHPRALADLPCRAIVGIGRHDVVGVEIESISLEPEHPCLGRGGCQPTISDTHARACLVFCRFLPRWDCQKP